MEKQSKQTLAINGLSAEEHEFLQTALRIFRTDIGSPTPIERCLAEGIVMYGIVSITPDHLAQLVEECRADFEMNVGVARHFCRAYPKLVAVGVR